MHRILLIFIACVLFSNTLEALTRIEGRAEAYANTSIRLISFADYVTYREKSVFETVSNDSGYFSFTVDLKETRLHLLRIDDINATLYLEKDASYQLQFPEYTLKGGQILSKEKFINLRFQKDGSDSLNLKIREFNNAYDRFLVDNYSNFIQGNAQDFVRGFETIWINENDPEFLELHKKYAILNMKLSARYNRESVFNEAFLHGEIHENIQPYFDLTANFYNSYLKNFKMSKWHYKLENAINNTPNFDSIVGVLSTDKYLKHRYLAKFISLSELYFNYQKSTYNQENIEAIITQFSINEKDAFLKNVAENMLYNMKKLAVGTPAPPLSLVNAKGEAFQLSDLKGKYVYLDFWATWCAPCIRAFPLLQNLYDEYGDYVEIVSISIDKKLKPYEKFINENNYPWIFAHYNFDQKVIEEYGVVMLPHYYLIDPEGNLFQAPALSPTNGIERIFHSMKSADLKSKEPKMWDWNRQMKAPQKN